MKYFLRAILIQLIIIIILLPLPSFIVNADVVFSNDFEKNNKDKMTYISQVLCVSSKDGSVSVREEPGSDIVNMTLENGEVLIINWTYRYKGEYWGVIAGRHGGTSPGWIPMKQLSTYYTSKDFKNEHWEELYEYKGDLDELFETEEFYLWQWPGSDREKILYPVYDDLINNNNVADAYKDDEGREWLHLYLYNRLSLNSRQANGWVCIDQPYSDQIPAFNPAPEPQRWLPDDTLPMAALIIIIVLIAGTVAFIYILRK